MCVRSFYVLKTPSGIWSRIESTIIVTFSSSVPALEVRSLLFTETVLACLHFCCSLYYFLVLSRSFRSLKLIEGGNPFLSVLFHGPLWTVLISAASAFHPGSTSMRLHRYGPRSEESFDFSSSFQMMNFLFFRNFGSFPIGILSANDICIRRCSKSRHRPKGCEILNRTSEIFHQNARRHRLQI